jgi:DNA-binding CsgD family transcriptional regulator
MASEQGDADPLRGLTAKQRQVLDLLIEHKTSKEISRMLGISPHTVDQRILLARAKLQVATRSETAQAYRRLIADQDKISVPDIYDQSIYGSPAVAEVAEWAQVLDREATDGDVRNGHPAEPDWTGSSPKQRADPLRGDTIGTYHHVLPEAFDGRAGMVLRLGAIVVITVFITLMILGSLAIYTELTHMLDS